MTLRTLLVATPSFRELVFAPASVGRIEALGELKVLDDPADADAPDGGAAG